MTARMRSSIVRRLSRARRSLINHSLKASRQIASQWIFETDLSDPIRELRDESHDDGGSVSHRTAGSVPMNRARQRLGRDLRVVIFPIVRPIAIRLDGYGTHDPIDTFARSLMLFPPVIYGDRCKSPRPMKAAFAFMNRMTFRITNNRDYMVHSIHL